MLKNLEIRSKQVKNRILFFTVLVFLIVVALDYMNPESSHTYLSGPFMLLLILINYFAHTVVDYIEECIQELYEREKKSEQS